MLSFESTVHQDHIALWGVNDSDELLEGTLKIRVLELATGKEIRTVTRDVTLPAMILFALQVLISSDSFGAHLDPCSRTDGPKRCGKSR